MKDENSRAGFAHEMVMINLSVFHLLLPVAALSSGYISVLLTLSLIGSTIMISWIVRKAYQQTETELVREHWKLAWRRCKLLLIAYSISVGIMCLGWLVSSLQADSNMQGILLVVSSRIAAVPTVLVVLALFIMETTALSQARQGELPKK